MYHLVLCTFAYVIQGHIVKSKVHFWCGLGFQLIAGRQLMGIVNLDKYLATQEAVPFRDNLTIVLAWGHRAPP